MSNKIIGITLHKVTSNDPHVIELVYRHVFKDILFILKTQLKRKKNKIIDYCMSRINPNKVGKNLQCIL